LYKSLKDTLNVFTVEKLRIPEHYAVAFTMGVQTSIINEWLKTGMKESPKEIVTMITSVMKDIPKNIYNI